MILDVEQLRQASACEEQINMFLAVFPEGKIEVTRELAQAHLEFDYQWAANELLTAPALREYEKVTAPALQEYEKVRAAAFADAFNGQ